MQNIISNTASFVSNIASSITATSTQILRATLFVAIAFGLCGTVGVQKTEAAASTYFVDLTGNGCGNNCAGLQSFLASNNISTASSNGNGSNTNTNNSNPNGTSVNGVSQNGVSGSASPYPYQVYTNFASTDAYNAKTASYAKDKGPYPYQSYSYYQDPSSKYDSATTGQYPEKYYVYYGSDASTQMNKYKKTYTSTYSNTGSGYSAGYGAGSGSNSQAGNGFTITSIR